MHMTPSRNPFRRAGDEHGFTLAMAMGIMLISSIVCLAAFQAANGDLVPSGENSDRKLAYAAAESGIAWYEAKMVSDPTYWQKCDTGVTNGVPDPVNQPSVAAGSRKWKVVSGTGKSTLDYSIAVLPATGATCSTTNPSGTMLSTVDGSFKIRSTGRYHGELRSIVASVRRQRFLDYLWFTDFETLDYTVTGDPATCANYRASRPSSCDVINFISGDELNGPMHTNDDFAICGSPTFGRTASDSIEASGPAPGKKGYGGCTDNSNVVGKFSAATRTLQMPPSNAQLRGLTTPGTSGAGYRLSGTQYIRFNGNGTMTIDTPTGNPVTVNQPSNGVIYVDDSGCTNPDGDKVGSMGYTEGPGCANVYVSGTASKSVTIGSAKDIIIAPTTNSSSSQFDPATIGSTWTDADLKVAGTLNATTQQISGNVNIGLIANGFVRVYHRVSSGSNATGVRDVRIDAAMLSIDHSFIVDNWNQGSPVGALTVHGAIAQSFRGTVGTSSGGTVRTGYLKDYWYDDRLRYTAPPNFLDPINAAWSTARQNELVPPV